jgi:hypothetical protein
MSHTIGLQSTISFAINWIDFNHDLVDMNHLFLWISLPEHYTFSAQRTLFSKHQITFGTPSVSFWAPLYAPTPNSIGVKRAAAVC